MRDIKFKNSPMFSLGKWIRMVFADVIESWCLPKLMFSPLCEMCSNTEFFSGPYFPEKYRPEKTPYLDTFHAVPFSSCWLKYTEKEETRSCCHDTISVSFLILLQSVYVWQSFFTSTEETCNPKPWATYMQNFRYIKIRVSLTVTV